MQSNFLRRADSGVSGTNTARRALGIAAVLAVLIAAVALLSGPKDDQVVVASAAAQSGPGLAVSTAIGADRISIVSVSDFGGSQAGNGPEHIADGDLTTRWAKQGLPAEVVFDLGATQPVVHTKLSFYRWAEGQSYTYAVDVSTNGTNWTQVAQANTKPQFWNVLSFPETNARFVRVRFVSSPNTDWAGFWEAEVWGPAPFSGDGTDPAPVPTGTPAPFPTTPPAATPVPTTPPSATPVPTSPPSSAGVVADSGLLAFDGNDDYVNLNTIDVTGNRFTVEAWINSKNLSNCPHNDCRIISKATGTANDDHVWMISSIEENGSQRLRFRLKAGGSTTTLIAGSTGTVVEGQWYHVAATYDGSKMRLFINGVIVGSAPKTGSIAPAPSVPVWVGANPATATDRPWEGWIDEVRIWNVSRGAGQLSGAMHNELTGSEAGLVAYYRFNQGSITSDIAGSNNATLGSFGGADASDPTPLASWDDVTSPPPPPPNPTPVPTTPPNPNGGNCQYTNPNQPFDDPNPPINSSGTEGRLNVSSSPVPAGYPTPLTTGICGAGIDPSDLTPSSGFTVTQNGAVIDRMDISGTLIINANNVTVRNSRITSGSRYVLDLQDGYTGLLVEDTRLRSTGSSPDAVVMLKGFATFNRVHLTGAHDGMKSYGGVLVQNSYFTGQYRHDGSHNDVVQIRSGTNYTFRNNTMIGPWRRSTSVFIIQAKGGNISNVLLENNYLSGGGFTVYTTQTSPFTLSNAVVRNNRIELDSWEFGWNTNSGGATRTGNQLLPS